MLAGVRQSIGISEKPEKLLMCFLVGLNVLASLAEAFSIGSVFVFLKVGMDPDNFGGVDRVREIYKYWGFTDIQSFLVAGSLAIFLVFLSRVILQFLAVWLSVYIRKIMQVRVSGVIFKGYMNSSYKFFLNTSYSSIVNNISSNVSAVVTNRTLGLVEIISATILAGGFIFTLLIVKPWETLIVFLFLSVAAAIYWKFVHTQLSGWGERLVVANARMYGVVAEVSHSFKTILVFRKQKFFARKFQDIVSEQSDVLVKTTMVHHVPRLSFEILIIGSVCLVMAFAFSFGDDLVDVVPTVALFGVASLRMLPAIMRIITSAQQYKQSQNPLDVVYPLYLKFSKELSERRSEEQKVNDSKFSTLELKGVSFNYSDKNGAAVKDVDLKINSGQMIGLAGYSGSGKSTTVDILLGLLPLSAGSVFINGESVSNSQLKGSGLFGYVPQEPVILEDTLRANIAFGVPTVQVDDGRVIDAIEMAALGGVYESLENGLDTFMGSMGGALSGGEKQRLGIARALYHNAEVLVLDEPTSSLDAKTENMISQALDRLKGTKTIIVIAHRLSSLAACDEIVVFDNGKIIERGTFKSLKGQEGRFAEMVEFLNVNTN